jgi:drug/metabolite transporter (DMT)-like permease
MLFYLPIALTALATTLYHVAQKSIVPGVHPMVSLVVTYATSLVACLATIPFAPGGAVFVRSIRDLNWATYVVGLSIVGVELAILLAYRAGWRISLASVIANVTTALLLVIIGVFVYREHLAARHVVGLLMCLGGLVLAARP